MKIVFFKIAYFLLSGVMIYASFIFHSRGTFQSNTFSPDLKYLIFNLLSKDFKYFNVLVQLPVIDLYIGVSF